MSDKAPEKKEEPRGMHHAVLAAIIVAAGAVLAAFVGLIHKGGSSDTAPKNAITGNGNVQGNTGTTIVGSSNVTVERQESKFDVKNGISIENFTGDYTVGSSPP